VPVGESALAIMVVLAAAGFDAWRIGAGDDLARNASGQIDWWLQRHFAPGPAQWSVVESRLEEAGRLSPSDPSIPELLGVLHLQFVGSHESIERSLADFGRSLSLRPSSPYTWADLAEARMSAGKSHDEIRRAMLVALSLGPAEPEVQRMAIDLGLAMWGELPAPVQGQVSHAIEQTMRRTPYRTLPIAFARGHLELVCPYVRNDARLANTVWPRRCKALGIQ